MGCLHIVALTAGALALDLVLSALQLVIRTTSMHPMHINAHPPMANNTDAFSPVGAVGHVLMVHP